MPIAEVQVRFGKNALSQGLFYANAPALRFELSGGGHWLDLFLQAIDRARIISTTVFQDSSKLALIIAVFVGRNEELLTVQQQLAASFTALGLADLQLTEMVQDETQDTGDPELTRVLLAGAVLTADLPRLLWGLFAQELNVTPTLPPCQVYLADLAGGILIHPYDDRGMDVIGPNTPLLGKLYRDFNDWLLDYDRERMKASFEPLGS